MCPSPVLLRFGNRKFIFHACQSVSVLYLDSLVLFCRSHIEVISCNICHSAAEQDFWQSCCHNTIYLWPHGISIWCHIWANKASEPLPSLWNWESALKIIVWFYMCSWYKMQTQNQLVIFSVLWPRRKESVFGERDWCRWAERNGDDWWEVEMTDKLTWWCWKWEIRKLNGWMDK